MDGGKLGRRLTQARQDKNMTQAELAKQSGIHEAAISHFECGRRIPSVSNFIKLVNALCVKADYLLGINEGKEVEDLTESHHKCDCKATYGK